MNIHHTVAAIVVSFGLSACTEHSLPEFDSPIPITVPSGKPAYGPRLTQSDHDNAILSWMERRDDGQYLHFSQFGQDAWQPPKLAVSDASMFVNWADLPAINRTGAGALLAYWLSYTAEGAYSYQVLSAHSSDEGESWSVPSSPHTDSTPTEHGFVSSYSAADGTGLIWLDGRNTPEGGMTLRGATLAPDGSLSDEAMLDDLVCDCCQTDIAETPSGQVAVYRDRTEDEVRDIFVARLVNGKWQPGTAVSDDGWVISGCPVNGPSIAAVGKRVVVAWFTAADNKPIVKIALSNNSGKTFSDPIEISSKKVIGRAAVAMITEHAFAVSWVESDKNNTYGIKLRGLTTAGQLGRVHTVGRTSVGRTVPQMVRVADNLVLAWTDEMSDLSKVVSVKVPILGFYD